MSNLVDSITWEVEENVTIMMTMTMENIIDSMAYLSAEIFQNQTVCNTFSPTLNVIHVCFMMKILSLEYRCQLFAKSLSSTTFLNICIYSIDCQQWEIFTRKTNSLNSDFTKRHAYLLLIPLMCLMRLIQFICNFLVSRIIWCSYLHGWFKEARV